MSQIPNPWNRIQHICNVILALGAIAAVLAGTANWLRRGVAESPVAAPVVDIDNSSQNHNHNEGAEATAETGPINIEVDSNNDTQQPTTQSNSDNNEQSQTLVINTPSTIVPTQQIQPATTSTRSPAVIPEISQPAAIAQQVTPASSVTQSNNGSIASPNVNGSENTQINIGDVNTGTVTNTYNGTVYNGDAATNTYNGTVYNGDVCPGAVGSSCAPESTTNNDFSGANITGNSSN